MESFSYRSSYVKAMERIAVTGNSYKEDGARLNALDRMCA